MRCDATHRRQKHIFSVPRAARCVSRCRARGDVETHEQTDSILSAGCATGDEPYSLAMTVLDYAPQAAARTGRRVRRESILARKAREGIYAPWALREDRPGRSLATFQYGTTYRLARDVRDMVRFDSAIWCWRTQHFGMRARSTSSLRNVVMYFDVRLMRSVIERIANATNARGFLFLGHAETLRGIPNDFHLRHSPRNFLLRAHKGDTAIASPIARAMSREAKRESRRSLTPVCTSWRTRRGST